MLGNEEFEKVCKLSKISIEEGKKDEFLKKLNGVFEWIEQLACIDVSQINLNDVNDIEKTLEIKDEPAMKNTRDQILSNTDHSKFGMFSVPKVVE